ncbi:unnamed protein product [Acanthoscelides obtectus]|uniref:Uncharacterized protein n=1 Tax=Acanthoscelides obtectus TaxID=200917 RepID=A0A9P0NSS6_ACAOB|nr:unnamed protein product [Acanthoscelides obtectus]CAK1639989.1 hypothetical protein AOBTE_LOCUS11486 [Acanthoscelides obtectus]
MGNSQKKSYNLDQDVPRAPEGVQKRGDAFRNEPIEIKGEEEDGKLRNIVDAHLRANAGVEGDSSGEKGDQ